MTASKSNEEFLTEIDKFLASSELNVGNLLEAQDAKRLLQKANDHKRSQTYRERKRAERNNLRAQVQDLTSKLAKQKANTRKSTWKMIAKYQRDARFHAETLQRQLRSAVDMKTKLIDAFQTCLNETLDRKLVQEHNGTPEKADTELFEMFVNELDEIYAQTDETLHDFGPEPSINGWKEGNKTGHYIYTKIHFIPANFQDTCRLLWQVALMPHRQESRELFGDAQDPQNTVVIKFRIAARLSMGVASVLQYVVVRRYQEDSRLVLVWRSFAEGEGMFLGMHANETGWCVASPSTNETELRICERHVPMHFRGVAAEVKQFRNFVLGTGVDDAFETTHQLEELVAKQYRQEDQFAITYEESKLDLQEEVNFSGRWVEPKLSKGFDDYGLININLNCMRVDKLTMPAKGKSYSPTASFVPASMGHTNTVLADSDSLGHCAGSSAPLAGFGSYFITTLGLTPLNTTPLSLSTLNTRFDSLALAFCLLFPRSLGLATAAVGFYPQPDNATTVRRPEPSSSLARLSPPRSRLPVDSQPTVDPRLLRTRSQPTKRRSPSSFSRFAAPRVPAWSPSPQSLFGFLAARHSPPLSSSLVLFSSKVEKVKGNSRPLASRTKSKSESESELVLSRFSTASAHSSLASPRA